MKDNRRPQTTAADLDARAARLTVDALYAEQMHQAERAAELRAEVRSLRERAARMREERV